MCTFLNIPTSLELLFPFQCVTLVCSLLTSDGRICLGPGSPGSLMGTSPVMSGHRPGTISSPDSMADFSEWLKQQRELREADGSVPI